MPGELKRLLSDEVRRTGRSLNDVAVGILASRFAVSFDPSGRAGKDPGKSGSVLLRMPPELKDKLAARARAAQAQRQRPDRRDALGAARRKGTHGFDQRQGAARRQQGPRRDHRRRQLRELARAGRRVLQGRQPGRLRPGPDARRPRRLPHQRHRVHGRLRRHHGQGRQGPLRGDLGASEQHDQVLGRPEDRHHRLARDDARRARQVPLRDRREGPGRDRRRGRDPQGHEDRRRRSTTSRSAPRRRPSGTRSRSSRPAARW